MLITKFPGTSFSPLMSHPTIHCYLFQGTRLCNSCSVLNSQSSYLIVFYQMNTSAGMVKDLFVLPLRKSTVLFICYQVFKFIYACRLAEAGLSAQAFHYCEVISRTVLMHPGYYSPFFISQIIQVSTGPLLSLSL